jgi:hypothetical protein
MLRRYGEAIAIYNRALALETRNNYMRVYVASIRVDAEADTAPLRAVLNTIEAEGPSSAAEVAEESFQLALRERDPTAAARALANIPSEGTRDSRTHFKAYWLNCDKTHLAQQCHGRTR